MTSPLRSGESSQRYLTWVRPVVDRGEAVIGGADGAGRCYHRDGGDYARGAGPARAE